MDALNGRFGSIGSAFAGDHEAQHSGQQRKIWSTNPLERVNKEIKRRSRVVGIFPNAAAVIRLVGAVLIDMHDEWIAGDRRYLSDEARSTRSEGDASSDPISCWITDSTSSPLHALRSVAR